MRALNMQALTNDVKARYPGVVIYGIGDDAHKLRYSDHNEDDTPGSLASQSDADSVQEHRAIDVMLGSNFSKSDADLLVKNILSDPKARARLVYIIFYGHIWRKSNGWVMEVHSEDPHNDHVHFSGWAGDDENTAHWPAVDLRAPAPTPKPPPAIYKVGSTGAVVTQIQVFLRNTFPAYRNYVTYMTGKLLVVDANFGGQTESWVKEFQKRTGLTRDGIVGPLTFNKMRQYGYKY